jgi:hypothetical protein
MKDTKLLRLSINLPEPMHRGLRIAAALASVTMQDIVIEALNKHPQFKAVMGRVNEKRL